LSKKKRNILILKRSVVSIKDKLKTERNRRKEKGEKLEKGIKLSTPFKEVRLILIYILFGEIIMAQKIYFALFKSSVIFAQLQEMMDKQLGNTSSRLHSMEITCRML
jgi:hypothetical protein